MDFDETRLYYTHQQLQRNYQTNGGNGTNDDDNEHEETNMNDGGGYGDHGTAIDDVNPDAVRRHFKEFLRKLFVSFVVHFCLFINFTLLHCTCVVT